MALSRAQLRKLEPLLAEERPNDKGEVGFHCPFHDDKKRSASINIETGAWFCHGCEAKGGIKQLLAQLENPEAIIRGARNEANGGNQPGPLPSQATIKGWCSGLRGKPLEAFGRRRGLSRETIEEFNIGWDADDHAYTIPVYDEEGQLVNVRRYQLDPPKGRRKIWSIRGRGHAVLYPAQVLPDLGRQVIICEGELDALLTMQNGFDAITRTGAASVWSPEWNQYFRGKDVYLCHDADKAGQAGNRKVERALRDVARSLYIVRLPYPITEKNGKDLTDYWLEGHTEEDFKELLAAAEPSRQTQRDEEIIEASVLDTLNAANVGKILKARVTVSGKTSRNYSVLQSGTFSCDQSAGTKCTICPMNKDHWNGEHEFELDGGDPTILGLMGVSEATASGLLLGQFKIPTKCPAVEVDLPKYVTVEELYIRPSVDQRNDDEESVTNNRRVVCVGRHDTMTNNVVEMTGTLWPNPKNQITEFQVWDTQKVETSIDRLDMKPSTIKQLQKFQPKAGETVWRKCTMIADEMAYGVTRIVGRVEMHIFMDLVWHSVLNFNLGEEEQDHGWLDAIIIGDTRTGKSEAAKRLSEYYGVGQLVNAENATIAGIVGGLQQLGGKDWMTTWGAIPQNDRRLVVLDEISGLKTEQISEMSSVRSSGVAQLTKIQNDKTWARTRLLWLSNPRGGSLANYTYGVHALERLVGNPEDIARFDMAMAVRSGDVAPELINSVRKREEVPSQYTGEDCNLLLRWAWSRRADQVVITKQAEEKIRSQAISLGSRYVEDPPLVQAANMRFKLARISVALAARTFSTDRTGEQIIVKIQHVAAAVKFLDIIYQSEAFGYMAHSKELIEDAKAASDNYDVAKGYIVTIEGLARFLRGRKGHFRRQDLEDFLAIGKFNAQEVIDKLFKWRMVTGKDANIVIGKELHNIIRTVKE